MQLFNFVLAALVSSALAAPNFGLADDVSTLERRVRIPLDCLFTVRHLLVQITDMILIHRGVDKSITLVEHQISLHVVVACSVISVPAYLTRPLATQVV